MKTVIKPETINILSASPKGASTNNEAPSSEAKPQVSRLSRIKSWAKEIYETLKPILGILTLVSNVIASLKKLFGKSGNQKGSTLCTGC